MEKQISETKKQDILFLYLLLALAIFLNSSVAFSGVATLSWNAPTTNGDGTPLTDLAGYKIYYGTSSSSYSQSIDVGNTTTYTIEDLTEGLTYYFATTAYDAGGNESGYSNEVVKTVPLGTTLTNLPKTGQEIGYLYLDDGYFQAGIKWPTPRFTDNGDGTVTDNLTGLMWLKDGGCIKKNKWKDSLNAVAEFNNSPGNYNCLGYIANYSDWRLPNVKEIESLINYGVSDSAAWLNSEGFVNLNSTFYWSSTTHQVDPSYAWLVKMSNGKEIPVLKSYRYYVWLARGTQ